MGEDILIYLHFMNYTSISLFIRDICGERIKIVKQIFLKKKPKTVTYK